ncbi:ATP-binding protein [Paenibacillus sp. FSL R7-0273]|uniref:thiol reductant ABC exporter subunit CydC n=1 Tax=Paenibacillus sp. FSL R7-0273 TaxID=1536772 RepID=UPI0004F6846F|nr:thiol reductant ABC exporter subunit CydC [Paenibacillus sp. FSL R7-0273]AIQ50045.1 ATP-binding protein [Paenibacillus sp. FSL R7-0273]OMF90917.1 thiol reductant ABC exporter subunit CydC [Paenibacillus sp. FSL R7-0273]
MKREGWFAPYASSYFWRFLLIIVLGSLTIFSASSLMYTSGLLISKSSIPPENILMVYVPIVGVRTFGTSRAVIHYVERLIGHDTILRILSKMRTRLYNILEPQALFLSSRFRTGDILGMLADDIEYLQNVYLRTVFPSIIALLIYAAAIIALGTFDLAFALLMGLYMLVLVVVLPLLSLLFTQRRQRQVKQERNRLYQKLTDAVLGMGDWMISGRQAQFVATYEADEREVARTDGALRSWARLRLFIGQAVVGLAVLSMLYWSAGEFAEGGIAGTLIAAFVLVVFPVADAFLPVSEAVEKIPQYRNSLERLNGVEAVEETVSRTAVESGSTAVAAQVRSIQSAGQARIELKSAGYRYAADAGWSVQNLSLELPQGRKIAVIGRSGAGKSTLLKMVQGVLAPAAGSVTINGLDASAYGEQIPQIIAVLNQSPHLFDTTVANNIRLGDPAASEEDIRKAAALAKLDTLISSLPEGYNTPVREAGQRFSGGERQRMALARILLQNTPVVVLDEPTVGLDPRTERELLATMFETMAGKTLIWVTHHLVGAEQMDEVIFMEDGRVEMRGTHAELMDREPRYRKLYELDRPVQFTDGDVPEQA